MSREGDSERYPGRQPPMNQNKYRCPLTRYRSKPVSYDCHHSAFNTTEEALNRRHGDERHNHNICRFCHLTGGTTALVSFFDKPSSLKSHLISSVHAVELRRMGLYEMVQQSNPNSLDWLALYVQVENTVREKSNDNGIPDSNAKHAGYYNISPDTPFQSSTCLLSIPNTTQSPLATIVIDSHTIGPHNRLSTPESTLDTPSSDETPPNIPDLCLPSAASIVTHTTISGYEKDLFPPNCRYEEIFRRVVETALPDMRHLLNELEGPVTVAEDIHADDSHQGYHPD